MEFELYLIRHAESEANTLPHLIGGRSEEVDITEKGRLQARLLNARLKAEGFKFDSIYSSTFKRAISTCDLGTYGIFPWDEVVFSDQLVEMSQGEWEGEERTKIHTDPVLIEMNSKGKFYIPGNGTGESQRMIERRASNWFEDEVMYNPKYQEAKSSIAIFTHGQWIRAFLHYVMNHNDRLMHRIKIDNTSITRLYFDKAGWGIGPEFNDTSHLKIQTDPRSRYDSAFGSGVVLTRGYARSMDDLKWLRERYLDQLDWEKSRIKGGDNR